MPALTLSTDIVLRTTRRREGLMTGRWIAQRRAVLKVARELDRLGLVSGSSGNVSLRLSDGGSSLLAITPTQRAYATLTAEDVVVADFDGEVVQGEWAPSSELLLHTAFYRARRDVDAVIHSHALYATVCAVTGLDLPPLVDEMVVLVGGPVRVADYAFPSTAELAENACRALGENRAVLLRNHGMAAVGRDLAQALEVCRLVERVAQVYVFASLLGKAYPLPPAVVEREQALYRMRMAAERQAVDP